MKTKLLAMLLLAGSTMFGGTRVFFGFGVGSGPRYYAPPPPAAYYAAPVLPGPGYGWVNGYSYPVGPRLEPRWYGRPGYFAPRPYAGSYWAAPRHYDGRYRSGYWRR